MYDLAAHTHGKPCLCLKHSSAILLLLAQHRPQCHQIELSMVVVGCTVTPSGLCCAVSSELLATVTVTGCYTKAIRSSKEQTKHSLGKSDALGSRVSDGSATCIIHVQLRHTPVLGHTAGV